ncbi:MAG: hypothetical protein LBS50_04260 [Prevotellaceae bacterium]|jgi:hypothetical protein|nr:hypothetical protein [Prevotellaceae bacterium]
MKNLIIVFISTFSLCIYAQNGNKWEYPIKPTSKEWATLSNGKQMLDICQIPQEIIGQLSTKELAEICLNYPLYTDYLALNDERKGINLIIKNINGFSELAKRKDGTLELIKIYREFPILTQIPHNASKDCDIPYKLPFLELILSDSLFITNFNSTDLKDLKQIVLNKYEEKLKNSSVYSLHNVKSTLLLAAIIIKQNTTLKTMEQQKVINNFIQNYAYADSDLLTKISKIISEL